MNRIALLIFIILLFFGRYFLIRAKKKSAKYLWISFFILSTPLQFEFSLNYLNPNDIQGVWGKVINVSVPLILALLFFGYFRWKKLHSILGKNQWILYILLVLIISMLNPYNVDSFATFCFIFYFISLIGFFILASFKLSKAEIFDGLFDALRILCSIQVILAICFPLLKLSFVTELFHGKVAAEWATRMNTRVGAVGLFVHPGNLALFTILASSFFLATYLNGYRTKLSLFLLACNVPTIILTYSRTSYLAFVLVVSIVYFFHKFRYQNLLSVSNILKFVVPTLLFLGWLVYFSPFSENFLKSDSSDMVEARSIHFLIALTIFTASPIIGVGVNTHLTFFDHNSSIQKMLPAIQEFYTVNPIHNIHLIILTETGLIGFVLWICFLFNSLAKAKKTIANTSQTTSIFSLTLVGFIFAYIIYGLTGWAPLSKGLLPFFLFMVFCFNTYEYEKKV